MKLDQRLDELQVNVARTNDLLSDRNRANTSASLASVKSMLVEDRPKVSATLDNAQAAGAKLKPSVENLKKTMAQADDTLDHINTLVLENRKDLRASGKFQSVAQLGSSAQGEYVPHGRLYDFEEADKRGTITALVSMEFDILDRKTRMQVWSRFYSKTEPAQRKTISDVVAALDHNLEQGLTEVMSALNTYFSTNFLHKS